MITARNYAAQAEQSFIQAHKEESHSRNGEVYLNIVRTLRRSVKFAMPDGAKIFDDNLKGLEGHIVRLPFPEMSVEFYDNGTKTVIIAVELCDNTTAIMSMRHDSFLKHPITKKDLWYLNCISVKFPTMSKFNLPELEKMVCESQPVLKSVWDILSEAQRSEQIKRQVESIYILLELCEALTCRNVSTTNHQDASPANARRIKTGKLPFYETKMLVVDGNNASGKENCSGIHNPPRQHLRRGHIRRLPKGNIWVNSCVVGDASKGIISKQYQVVSNGY